MVKLVCLLQRRPEVSRKEFHRWWTAEHIPLVRKFPGLRKYVVSLTTRSILGGSDEWDGVAELWFESEQAVDAAYAAAAGSTGKSDTEAHVGRVLRFVTEEIDIPVATERG